MSDPGIPTSLDTMHALMYASDRIKEEKCMSPTIQAKYDQQILWKTNNGNRLYPCPEGLTGSCDTGHCHIISPDLCGMGPKGLSQLPWTSDGTMLQKCSTGHTGPYCISKPYLEWNTIEPEGKCIFGNFPLRRWCEFPHSRRKGANVNGATNVPPFKYYPDKSLCTETDAYCDWMEVSYRGDYDYPNTLPTCYLKKFQKIMEQWFVGKTIFRGIKAGFHKDKCRTSSSTTEEKYVHPDDKLYEAPGLNDFNNLTESGSRLCDEKYIEKKKLIGRDFAGDGVHLYSITWKDEAVFLDPDLKPTTTGFIHSELRRVYPKIMTKKTIRNHRVWFYSISKDDAKINNHLKRIYLLTFTDNWMMKNIAGMMANVKNMAEIYRTKNS